MGIMKTIYYVLNVDLIVVNAKLQTSVLNVTLMNCLLMGYVLKDKLVQQAQLFNLLPEHA